jgi:hypothetical protein
MLCHGLKKNAPRINTKQDTKPYEAPTRAAVSCLFVLIRGASPTSFQPAPLPLRAFLNSEGVVLVCFLKTALKEDFELKPTASAMAKME